MLEEIDKYLAALISCEGVGQRTTSFIIRMVEEKSLSWQDFWVGGQKLWRSFKLSEKQINSIESFQKEYAIDSYWEWLQQKNIRVITQNSVEYPPLLQHIENPPVVLFAQGALLDWNAGIPIAVVGTRHMTTYGKQVTEKITVELVWAGAQIISGFMYGIDSCAHRVALEAGGRTVGVLGFGFEHLYPRSHAQFYQECLQKGMSFLSPFAPQVSAFAGNFPARNAIVAGMSAAVVVTEAAEKSGTHITAAYAVEFGRTVCAVPGSILSPYSAGTKWLVNQGAVLVQSGEEVLVEIGQSTLARVPLPSPSRTGVEVKTGNLSDLQTKILHHLRSSSLTADKLALELQVSVSSLLSELSLLEIQGILSRVGESWQKINAG